MKNLILPFLLFFTFMGNNHAQTFDWVRTAGGADSYYWGLEGNLKVDASGNIYSVGSFRGTSDFDGIELTSIGGSDIFIEKVDENGNTLWVKSVGGPEYAWANSVAFDVDDNVYIVGEFYGTVDFDPGVGVQEVMGKDWDAFILKLDANGNFIWVKTIGGESLDQSLDMVVDLAGDIIIAGVFRDTVNFDPNASNFKLIGQGEFDAYLLKLDAAGEFIWVRSMGGTGEVGALSLDVDASNNIYTTGYFSGEADFDPTNGVVMLSAVYDETSTFIQKLNEDGGFLWAKSMNSSIGFSLAVDFIGNVISTGYFYETADFDPNVGIEELTVEGEKDIFIQKLDTEGNFVWAKGIGGKGEDIAMAVAVDALNNIFFTGSFTETVDFDPGETILPLTAKGESDIFIEKLDSDGNLVWIKSVEGTGAGYGYAIAIGEMGHIHVRGAFRGLTDFDPGTGKLELNPVGEEDIFILKLNKDGKVATENLALPATSIFPNPNNGHFQIALPQNTPAAQIKILDAFGKNVYQNQLNHSVSQLDLDHLPGGIYFLNMTLDTKEVYHGKIVLQK